MSVKEPLIEVSRIRVIREQERSSRLDQKTVFDDIKLKSDKLVDKFDLLIFLFSFTLSLIHLCFAKIRFKSSTIARHHRYQY